MKKNVIEIKGKRSTVIRAITIRFNKIEGQIREIKKRFTVKIFLYR